MTARQHLFLEDAHIILESFYVLLFSDDSLIPVISKLLQEDV